MRGTTTRTATTGKRPTRRRARYKRPFDLGLIAAAFVLLLPVWVVLGVTIAVAIRIEDGGPVLYRQRRLGRDGRPFEILKFRSMIVGAEDHTGPVWAAWRDTRTTRVGRVLRRCHLDELPQVVNVIRGDMSLVGPRPERPELAAAVERRSPASRAGFVWPRASWACTRHVATITFTRGTSCATTTSTLPG